MDKSQIIIYGASDDGKSFFEYLHPLVLLGLIEVVAFADNDTRMWGRDIGGVPVVPPMTIVEYKYDYVIVTPIFFDEISIQLSDLGISFDKLIPLHANHRRNFGRAAREFDNVKIGKFSYYKPGTKLLKCEIGNFCHIGDNCVIGLYGHDTTGVTTYPLKYHFDNSIRDCSQDPTSGSTRADTAVIKNDVYIGEGVIIFAGVTVGNGAVIGSRAVVTKDVPDYCVVAGVPAKVVRKRFSDSIVDALLEIRWWNWSDIKLSKHIDDFELGVDQFTSLHS
jgi:acetyltransferase-like isoleucine patch superfamily enzyme